MTDYPLGEKGAVLFSGGTDSTLAARLLSLKVRHLTLLTFDPGFIFFVENSQRHARKLEEKLGAERVTHEIIPIKPYIGRILFGDKRGDFRKYGFNLTSLFCLGCRLSMHTAAVIYNLTHGIPVIVDGSIRKQADIPEQLESFIHANRRALWTHYGLRHYSPIYEEDCSDLRLDEEGISSKKKLKRQFIFFDTQPTCPFGVPADVYARLFYSRLAGNAREVDTHDYALEKYPLVHEIIRRHFQQEGRDIEDLVANLKRLSDPIPASWPVG